MPKIGRARYGAVKFGRILTAGTIVLAVCTVLCLAQRPEVYQVYFVSVGSSWYVTPTGRDVHGFSRIPGANTSAKVISGLLVSGGAQYGIELTSEETNLVTVSDIYKAVRDVANRMNADKAPRPLFVFYFAGHGLSEGIAWNHFSVPGNFAYRGDASRLDIEGLSKNTLYSGELVDELQKLGVPFLVLLDNCYEGEERTFESSVLSGPAIRNLSDVGGVLRVMNEFRDTYPVLFSTTPGTAVTTVENPLEPGGATNIGPLSRRFSLSITRRLEREKSVALNALLEDMTSVGLDSLTKPAVTHSPVPQGGEKPFLVQGTGKNVIERRLGTGKAIEICCRLK